jgi:putative Holliday junction resolvase
MPETTTTQRILGLDIGDRRIGVALSDAMNLTAQPMFTLTRGRLRDDLRSLARLIRKHGVTDIIAGNPIHLSGDESSQAAKARAFAAALQAECGIPITLWDERLTTTEAHRHLLASGLPPSAHKAVVDQVAAVLILQSWLDLHNSQK